MTINRQTAIGATFGVLATFLLISLLSEVLATISPFDPKSLLPDGSRYRGDFRNDRFHGKGVLQWDNGNRYQGDFENGMLNGEGKLELSNGHIYEGEFSKGFMSGKGRLTVGNRLSYSGEFKHGFFHGQGELKEQGNHYIGEFANGDLNGDGTFTTKDGRTYAGNFVNGSFTGSGTMTVGDTRYQGEFLDWVFHGEGVFSNGDGDSYRGHFEQGRMVGAGEHRDSEGNRYRGEFQDWFYHGNGELTNKDGDHYKGQFEHGFKHGYGELRYAQPKAGVSKKAGKWEYDRFSDDQKAERARREAIVEQAIYGQEMRLSRHLENISPGERNRIDLYFMGIGGYGNQDVFRKEVRTVRELFDQHYGTRGRSLELINNADTVVDIPIATRTSIRQSLQAIESKMNIDEDILFLYATSHGSADHNLSLSLNGISLADISATTLADMLNETAIKWRIVVISACYSGGFIEPLKNETTLVITAAAKDRKSFGCSDKNEMTDFARAFFKESLPVSESFESAFGNATQLIKQEEKTRKVKQESLPQISMGKAMRLHLADWRRQQKLAFNK